MRELDSTIEGATGRYKEMRKFFHQRDFDIGGSWEYSKGFFDCKLDKDDEKNGEYVYLRIPAYAKEGQIDQKNAIIELGKPFVLVHRFESNNDLSATSNTVMGSLINQFQSPVEKDAPVDDIWTLRGEKKLRVIEKDFPFKQNNNQQIH
jgi:hypothetical protein